MEQAEALQASLYAAANQALLKAMDTDTVTPALLTSINKMLSEAGVQPAAQQQNHPLWSLAESMENLTYFDH